VTDEIRLDPATAQRIEGEIASMAEALQTERGKLDRRVGQLMGGGWTGVAAEQYGSGWGEWCTGADTVLQALAAMSRRVGEARVELIGTDDAVSGVHGRLHERLGPA
jgi:WXG100 family type VII secretion target